MEPAPEKRPVKVTILSQSYTLISGADTREVEELAEEVNRLMLGIAARAPNADTTRIAVMACLHLADRVRGLERNMSDLRSRVDRKTEEFAGLLEQALRDAG